MLALIALVLFLIVYLLARRDDFDSVWSIGLLMIIGLFLAVSSIGLVVSRLETRVCINKFYSTQATIEAARYHNDPIERAALVHKVQEQNAWLANTQYWNSKWLLDWYYQDEIETMKPIR